MPFSPTSPINQSDDTMLFPDDEILAFAVDENENVYAVGNSFTVPTENTGCVAVVSPTDATIIRNVIPYVRNSGILYPIAADPTDSPSINRIISDGNGGYYMCGSIRSCEGMPGSWDNMHKYVVHITPGGQVDANFKIHDSAGTDIEPYTRVYDMYLDSGNNRLYICGEFTFENVANLCVVNATTGLIDDSWTPNVRAASGVLAIMTIKVLSNYMYIGGDFDYVDSQNRSNIARFDITSFPPVLDAWDAGANAPVYVITLEGSSVYVGGEFTQVANSTTFDPANARFTRNRVAEFTTAGAVTTWNPNANNVVHAITIDGTDVYIGGEYDTISATFRGGIAKFSTAGALDSWDPQLWGATITGDVGFVDTILIDGSEIYLGGDFYDNFPLTLATFWNAWKGSKTTAVRDTTWAPQPQWFGGVNYIFKDQGLIFLAGSFSGLFSIPRYAVKYDANGNLDTTFDPPDTISDIDTGGDSNVAIVTVAAAPNPGQKLAVACGTQGLRLFNLTTGALENTVAGSAGAFAVCHVPGTTDFIVGGSFSTIAGSSRTNIAKIGTASLVADATWTPTVTGGSVGVLYWSAVPSGGSGLGYIYIGGVFTTINGTTRNKAGSVDAITGALSSFNPNVTSAGDPADVNTFLVYNTSVLAMGGVFDAIGGSTANHLAIVDSTTGALITNIALTSTGSNAGCTSLTTINNRLYLLNREGTINDMFVNGTIRQGLAEIVTPPEPTLWNISNGDSLPPGFGWLGDFSGGPGWSIRATSKFLYFSGGDYMGFQGGNCMHSGRCRFPDRVNILGTDAVTGARGYVTSTDGVINNSGDAIFGTTGIVGPPGLQGITGVGNRGPIGLTYRGITGMQGLTGADGLIGRTGISATGFLGLTGVRGLTGLMSADPNGATGIRGITGIVASIGITNVSSTPYTVLLSDYAILVDTSTLAITIDLPTTADPGKLFSISDTSGNAAANNITINTSGGPLINGLTSFLLNENYQIADIYFSGTNYFARTIRAGQVGITGVQGVTGIVGITGAQGLTGVEYV